VRGSGFVKAQYQYGHKRIVDAVAVPDAAIAYPVDCASPALVSRQPGAASAT
jgi:hypothetical protein